MIARSARSSGVADSDAIVFLASPSQPMHPPASQYSRARDVQPRMIWFHALRRIDLVDAELLMRRWARASCGSLQGVEWAYCRMHVCSNEFLAVAGYKKL